jgi:Fibronectin type III domain
VAASDSWASPSCLSRPTSWRAKLLALFPEGEYRFQGRTVEGDKLLGTATLTHAIPDGPVILTPEEGVLVDPNDAVISWDPVTEPAGIEIAGYRVIVERGDRGRNLSLELPPETTSVLVPPDFLEPGTDYLFQVFAIEAGGNQTISEGVFDTAEGGLGTEPEACGDETSKCVFLTSTNQNGNLGGLNGADGICQGLADADGSSAAPGTYKAWLSTAAVSAAARLTHATVPYKLVDGTTIAANWADLTDGALFAAINVNERGSSTPAPFGVSTATNKDGTFVGPDCMAWSSAIPTDNLGAIGGPFANELWTHIPGGEISCGRARPLYCLQQ